MKQKVPNWKLLVLLALFVITAAFFTVSSPSIAATNIDPVDHWAWSDSAGWWDFFSTDSVEVTGTELKGYASSSLGDMALNCNSTRIGDICASSNFRVVNNGASGDFLGCAWNDALGWIYFSCSDTNCNGVEEGGADDICSQSLFQVKIDANGEFTNYAWNDVEGWINFNCANDSSCGTSDYKVITSWSVGITTGYLESSIIDTQKVGGATLTSIVWQGSQPAGTSVDFQIAVSNSQSGPWSYEGPGGSTTSYYGAECPTPGIGNVGPNKAICVDKNITLDNRYLRYKTRLQSNTAQTLTPVVDDVILNWEE